MECLVKVWSLYVRFNIHSLDPSYPLAFLNGPPPMSIFFFKMISFQISTRELFSCQMNGCRENPFFMFGL